MPRLKCRFCSKHVYARPAYIQDKTYYCRCSECANSTPPSDWRCQGITKSSRGNRKKGDRCTKWVRRVGDKFCSAHKPKEEE